MDFNTASDRLTECITLCRLYRVREGAEGDVYLVPEGESFRVLWDGGR